MKHADRPTEMLLRQQQANREAMRYRNPETGKRNFCHLETFRAAFVRDILAIRRELRKRVTIIPHADHPMRHYDRTCPACNLESTD